MTFYELLKKKAKEDGKQTMLVGRVSSTQKHIFSYEDVLKLVDDTAEELIRGAKITDEDIGKPKYVVINNTISSIVLILALLKLKVIPVLIDAKNIGIESTARIPHIYSEDEDYFNDDMKTSIKLYIDSRIKPMNISSERIRSGNIVIFSSGSEGYNPHYNIVSEKELINLPNPYGERSSHFYSYISCANISGLLTNLVNPLVNDCTVILNNSFNLNNLRNRATDLEVSYYADKAPEETKEYTFSCYDLGFMYYLLLKHKSGDAICVHDNKVTVTLAGMNHVYIDDSIPGNDFHIDTIMFPRNIIEYLKTINTSDLDFSRVTKIYLTGGINSEETIKEIRNMIPSIKEGVFINLYGSTEANGVICSCSESNMRTCYIDISRYNKGEVYYTYDKKTIYHLKNGVSEEILGSFRSFEFNAYLSVSDSLVPNVVIDKMKIKRRKGLKLIDTGDIGIYIDNRLYVLGRKSDLLITEEKVYDIKLVEKRYQKLLRVPVYCVKDPVKNKIYLFIRYYKNNFKQGIYLYKRAISRRNDVVAPVLLNDNNFPMSTISGKVSKARLLQFAKYSKIQEDNFFKYFRGLKPEKEYAEKIIDEYFKTILPGLKAGPIGDDLCFEVEIKDAYITEFFNNISYVFDIVEIDDQNKKMKLRVLPQILFLTVEDFKSKLPVFTDIMRFRQFMISIIQQYSEEIKTWSYVEMDSKSGYNIKQLVRNFILMYIKELERMGISDVSFFPDFKAIPITDDRREKIAELLR